MPSRSPGRRPPWHLPAARRSPSARWRSGSRRPPRPSMATRWFTSGLSAPAPCTSWIGRRPASSPPARQRHVGRGWRRCRAGSPAIAPPGRRRRWDRCRRRGCRPCAPGSVKGLHIAAAPGRAVVEADLAEAVEDLAAAPAQQHRIVAIEPAAFHPLAGQRQQRLVGHAVGRTKVLPGARLPLRSMLRPAALAPLK